MAPVRMNTSSIALALAGMTASMDIPNHKHHDAGFWSGRESFAAVAAKSMNGNNNNKHRVGLPTPPNSVSSPLMPQGFKVRAAQAPPTPPAAAQVDSDIDLQDAVDHANAQDQPQHGLGPARGLDGLADMDAAGIITPGLLAKHHLPGILLDHGPLAIRHVMGFLTTSVPGFSGIAPAKARRLVGRALEGHGSGGELGGINGDVMFEKVGWGRWNARRRGEFSRDSRNRHRNENIDRTPPPCHGLQIPRHSARLDRNRQCEPYGTSMAGESATFSHDSEMEYDHPLEDISALEDEADNMSLDGESSCSSSEPPDDSPILVYDAGDVTDEEDWASIGAEALRNGSYPPNGSGSGSRLRSSCPYARHLDPKARGRGGGPPLSMLAAKPLPMPPNPTKFLNQYHRSLNAVPTIPPVVGFGSSDPQEREAIEALVRLSSV